jgi:dTDP-4-dehydrorhamnose 3,5-epimerase
MVFTETSLKGAYVIDLDRLEDERGFFARSFCQKEFAAHGMKAHIAQCNISFNQQKGTIRGMHFQRAPKAEAKLVRCTRAVIFDVIVDLRAGSPTYCKWISVELSATNYRALYIPEGFAHGFQTLEDATEVFYLMFEFFSPEHQSGLRYDDPAFKVVWPMANPIMSDRDLSYPLFDREKPVFH